VTSTINVKSRWSWLVMLLIATGLLLVGGMRDTGPLTQQDRIDLITKHLACPTCQGESVYVSRAPSAEAIRSEVARQVAASVRTNDEIIGYIEQRFGGQVLLVPRSTGLEVLVWALPVVAFVCAIAALAFSFRRWRTIRGDDVSPEDARLVADALQHEDEQS
jgi:cytochrome c-type biogenesis protein CcmH/NrfF